MMIKALVVKELRESAGIVALAMIAAVNALAELAGVHIFPWRYSAASIFPFVDNQHSFWLWLAVGGLAIALGFKQTAWEAGTGTYSFLLHRPLSRRFIFGVKLATGASLVLLVGLGFVLVYALWADAPGTHASPFMWSMTPPTWRQALAMTLVYLGAFLSGIRPARWFGTRLAPLVASVVIVVFANLMPWWWLWLSIIAVVIVVELASIEFYIRERDY
jgi:hypothetical protein